jgi:hypothetical protein
MIWRNGRGENIPLTVEIGYCWDRYLAIALSISAMIDNGTRCLEGPVEAARISR